VYLVVTRLVSWIVPSVEVPEIRPPTVTCGFATHPGSA
jgi:hypothetical protein